MFLVHKWNVSMRRFFYTPKAYAYQENEGDNTIFWRVIYFYFYFPKIWITDNSK